MPTTDPILETSILESQKPLDRKTQKIFAGSVPPEDNIAIFGSLAAPAAPPKDEDDDLPKNEDAGQTEGGESDENASAQEIYSDDPDKIQSDAYKKGWVAAVVSDDSPALEDMNALFYLITRQLAYLYEKGIPEWDPGTIYYKGSVCLHPETKTIYISQENTNLIEPGTDKNVWFELGSDKVSIIEFVAALAKKADATALAAHTANANNPHGVTKQQLGLGNVQNTSDKDKEVSTATSQAIAEAAKTINERIDAAELASNSVDVVGTHAALLNYNTRTITVNDIITVIADETNDSRESYWRWDGTTWELIGVAAPIPAATETTKGIVTLGASGGAARHEDSRFHAHANKNTLDNIGEQNGAPLWNGAMWPGGGGADLTEAEKRIDAIEANKSEVMQSSDTCFIDDKFGDDATGEMERMDRPFKTMEEPLSRIAKLGSEEASIIIDNWSITDMTSAEQLPDGRRMIAINEQILLWTDHDNDHYTNSINIGSNFQMAGFSPKTGDLFVYNPQATQQTTGEITVQPYHGLIYNINNRTWNSTDWTAPMWLGGNIPTPGKSGGAIGGGRAKIFPNGNIAYTWATGGTAVIAPDGSRLLHQSSTGGDVISNGVMQQMRFCTNKIFPPYLVSKYSVIITQDGKYLNFSGGGGTHWAYNDTYLVQSKEASANAVILQLSLIESTADNGSVSGYQFNWASWNSNTAHMYNNRFYNGSNPLKTLDVTAVDGTGKVTAVAITGALDINGDTFATGGNHHGVAIKGGLVFSTKQFFNIDYFGGEDKEVQLAILDLGARQDVWTPANPVTPAGGVLRFWPSRISIHGRGRYNTRVDLSSFSQGLDIHGSDTWMLSYNPVDTTMPKYLAVRDAHVDTVRVGIGTFMRCQISILIDLDLVSATDCFIETLTAASGTYKRCTVSNLAGDSQASFLGCDILSASSTLNSSGTFKGCRLPVGFMTANPSAIFNNCMETY